MTETGAGAGSANEAARRYIEEGMSVLPAAAGEKEARIKGWQNLILGLDSVDEWFPPSEALNIVRVNGTNSNGRGDIDLDRPEALKIVDYLIPDDVRRFGREGQSLGHVEVRFVDDTVPRSAKYALPGDGNDRMMVELRADGSQTLIHGTYPNGDRCVWEGGEVLAAHATTLHSLAADIAVGALLLLNYPGAG